MAETAKDSGPTLFQLFITVFIFFPFIIASPFLVMIGGGIGYVWYHDTHSPHAVIIEMHSDNGRIQTGGGRRFLRGKGWIDDPATYSALCHLKYTAVTIETKDTFYLQGVTNNCADPERIGDTIQLAYFYADSRYPHQDF